MKYFYVEAEEPLNRGEHQLRVEFVYDEGGLGKGGTATLYVDRKKAGEGRIDVTAAAVFSADDGCDVGRDTGAPVSQDYGPRNNAFNGVIKGIQLAIADDRRAADHLIDPKHALEVALARQ
jgi:arylsulfatase